MKLFGLIAFLPFVAMAQTADMRCLPKPIGGEEASELSIRYANKQGFLIEWRCKLAAPEEKYPSGTQLNQYCILNSELEKVGGRLKTILGAADPLRSAQLADTRFAVIAKDTPEYATVCGPIIDALK